MKVFSRLDFCSTFYQEKVVKKKEFFSCPFTLMQKDVKIKLIRRWFSPLRFETGGFAEPTCLCFANTQLRLLTSLSLAESTGCTFGIYQSWDDFVSLYVYCSVILSFTRLLSGAEVKCKVSKETRLYSCQCFDTASSLSHSIVQVDLWLELKPFRFLKPERFSFYPFTLRYDLQPRWQLFIVV